MKIVSVLILSVVTIVAIEAKRWCRMPTFVKETCRNDQNWAVVGGNDGVNGKNGQRGMCGARGRPGRDARLCNLPKKTKIVCNSLRYEFEKIKDDTRWMEKTLDLIDGLDIDSMTKEELIKIVISQSYKIVTDHDRTEEMEKEIEKLKEQLKDCKEFLAVVEKIRKQLKQKFKENAEKDGKIKELNDKIANLNVQKGGNDKLKQEIKNLKATIAALSNKLKEVKNSADAFKKLHNQIKKLHGDLKKTTKNLEDEVARLKKQLLNKELNNEALQHKIKKLEDELVKARKACDNVKAENVNLLKQLKELKKKCEENGNAQNEIIAKLRKQIDDLKEKIKDIDAHKEKVNELEKKIKELEAINVRPKFSVNSILCSGDDTKTITTIPKSSVEIFSKYKKKNIELPCVTASDGSGPWFVLLDRHDGSVNFKQNFKTYQQGFGNQKGEFWLGLDAAHALTSHKAYRLRVELEDHKGNKHYASYSQFQIGGGSDYRLSTDGFKGDIYNTMKYHQNQRFSTYDKDQDGSSDRHCAEHSGGWWYKRCQLCALTGTWSSKWVKNDPHGIRWRARNNKMYTSYYSWKKARMLIQPKV